VSGLAIEELSEEPPELSRPSVPCDWESVWTSKPVALPLSVSVEFSLEVTVVVVADFGPKFVELARSVYKSNDHRAALKRSINELLGSAIVEEKSYGDGAPA
jgi:hypothetical protein